MYLRSFTDEFKTSMRVQGRDIISFHKDLAKKLSDQIQDGLKIDLQEDYCLVLLEAYRRNCVGEILKIFAFLINRDVFNFTQILKKYYNTKFLSQIFGEDYDFKALKNQSDPLYYLEIMDKILSHNSPIPMSHDCSKLFQKIDQSYELLMSEIPQLLKKLISSNNKVKYPLTQFSTLHGDVKLQVRLCFLAVYSDELCTKLSNSNHPYFIFKDKIVNYVENEDNFLLETLSTHSLFIVTNTQVNKKLTYSQTPLVVDFTEDEISDIKFYTNDQFNELKKFIMIDVGNIYYPKNLSQSIFFGLQNRLNEQIDSFVGIKSVKGSQYEDKDNIILTIKAHSEIKSRIIEKGILVKEQAIINIFNYQNRIQKEKLCNPVETEYIDAEYKCKFIFGDGLFIDNWLLPNEYDSIQIENFPEDELSFFLHFNLNYRVILSIVKENNSIIVKCLNSNLAQLFFNHIQGQHLVLDKQNRIIVKPLITENLHTNKSEYVVQVKYKSNYSLEDHPSIISSFVDRFAKNEYKLQMGRQTDKQERICYLIFDKKERTDFIKDTMNQQVFESIQFINMEISELKQGKITIDYKVYLFYEQLLRLIKETDYKIILPFDKTYEEEEKTLVGFNNIQTKTMTKEVISLFSPPKNDKYVNIIIQAKTDKNVFKGIYNVQTLIKPKHIYQIKDKYQYNILIEKDGREKLKNLSIESNIFFNNNYNLNRIEFHYWLSSKEIKQQIENYTKKIDNFIDNYEIKMQYPISQKDSKKIIDYLKSKKFEVSHEQNKIQTKIKYSKIKEENSYIIENFVKPLHDNMQDCQICYDTQELFALSKCGCKTICKNCLRSHVKDKVISSITDYQMYIKCPSCDKQPISMKDLNLIFNQFDLQDIFKIRFKAGIDSLVLDGQKVFKGCEFPDCKGIFKVPTVNNKDQKQNWQCPMCQHEYCIKHILNKKFDLPLHDIHNDDITCEAQTKDVGVKDLVSMGLVKQCPNCKAKYSHEEGCNHLTCQKCKCHFCAICEFFDMSQDNKAIYKHLTDQHQGAHHFKARNINNVDAKTKELLEKKMQKKINKQGKQNGDDSDEEQDVYLKLNLQKSYVFSQYDHNIQHALFLDEESIPQISHQLFDQ